MIVAWRIPMLTARMLAATREAAERQPKTALGVHEHTEMLERYLVRSLERLGYRVILERTAA